MNWLPPSAVGLLFLARLIELTYRFPAQSGKIEAPLTLHALTVIGSLTVAGSVAEYFLTNGSSSVPLVLFGLLLGLAAFALRAAARRELGRMWSIHVEVREDHVIAQSGPYRFIRHPIYVAAVLELLAVPVVLSTWRVATVGVVLYVIALAWRVRCEEQAHSRLIGRRWDEYVAKTGAFFPRW